MTWTATEWTLLAGGISTSIVSIIYTLQKSRCTVIQTPCGCHCERDLECPTEDNPTLSIPPPPPLSSSPLPFTPRSTADRLSEITYSIASPNVKREVKRLEERR